MTKETRSTLLLSCTAIIWGVGFVAQSVAMNYMGPLTFNAVRFLLAGIALIPVIKFFEGGIDKHSIKGGLVCGFVCFIGATLQQFGILFTGSAGMAGFISGLYIIIVPILGVFLGRKAGLPVWVGAALAVIGLYLISSPDDITAIDMGTLLLIACAFAWAIHIFLIDKFVAKAKPLGISMVQCFVIGTFSFIAAFIFEDIQPVSIVSGYLPILYSAFISIGIAYTLQFVGQKHVPPGRSAVIFSMESVVAAISEVIILGTFLATTGYIGGALIFAGIIISQRRFASSG